MPHPKYPLIRDAWADCANQKDCACVGLASASVLAESSWTDGDDSANGRAKRSSAGVA
jgi:hypothetical protein